MHDFSAGPTPEPPPGTLYLIIPVFNEAANIRRLLHDVDAAAPRLRAAGCCAALCVVLVDDGSTDDTREVARAGKGGCDLLVLRHPSNRGPGAAMATGFAELGPSLKDVDLVFTMEGDNTSRLDTAHKMLIRQREGYDMVLASPYAYGGGFQQTAFLRLVLSHVANGSLKGILGIQGFHTMSSFFRLYTGRLLQRLQAEFGPGILECAGFECMVELLIKAVLLRAPISEVEMLLDSSQRVGQSKMRILRTIRGYLGLVRRRYKWSRQLRSKPWSYRVGRL